MPRTTPADWIVTYDGTQRGKPPMSMECTQCGSTLTPSLPISASHWLALAKVFGKEHKKCRERGRA